MGKIKELAAKTGKSKLWTPAQMIRSVGDALREGEEKADKAILILVDTSKVQASADTNYSWFSAKLTKDEALTALIKVHNWLLNEQLYKLLEQLHRDK